MAKKTIQFLQKTLTFDFDSFKKKINVFFFSLFTTFWTRYEISTNDLKAQLTTWYCTNTMIIKNDKISAMLLTNYSTIFILFNMSFITYINTYQAIINCYKSFKKNIQKHIIGVHHQFWRGQQILIIKKSLTITTNKSTCFICPDKPMSWVIELLEHKLWVFEVYFMLDNLKTLLGDRYM